MRVSAWARTPRVLGLLLLAACGGPDPIAGEDVETGGTVLVALIGEPKTLLPALLASEHEQAVVEIVYDRLADIGPKLDVMDLASYTPRLAASWRWASDSMSIAFTLNPRARWHDGAPFVSEDVRRTFELYADPRVKNGAAALLGNIDSVSAPDSSTAVFWFKRRAPQQFFDAVHHLFIMPSHLLTDADPDALAAAPLARAPVGTGRFRFVRWSSDGRIEVLADTGNFRGRPSLDRVIFESVSEAGSAMVKLLIGESDFAAPLLPQTMEQVQTSPSVRPLVYPSLRYQLLTFNLRAADGGTQPHPILSDKAVRRALTLASNRERIVRTVFDSLGEPALGPVPRQGLPDTLAVSLPPFDVDAARALLDSAGWVVADDGIRERNGVRLRIEVLVPGTSENRNRMAVLLQDQWRAVGAELVPLRLDLTALLERLDQRQYDAVMNGWSLTPGLVGLRQAWMTRSIGPDGNNYAAYSNPVVDANIDSMLLAFDAPTRDRTLLRAVQVLIDDAPAIWLVEDKVPAGMHTRIEPGPLSALGWWQGLADWSIAADRRLDRDRIGLSPVP